MSVGDFFLGPDGGADEVAALMVLAVLVFLGLEVYSVVAKGATLAVTADASRDGGRELNAASALTPRHAQRQP